MVFAVIPELNEFTVGFLFGYGNFLCVIHQLYLRYTHSMFEMGKSIELQV